MKAHSPLDRSRVAACGFAAVSVIVFALVRNVMEGRRAAAAERVRATAKPSGELTPVGDVDMWRR
jgi:hypothetical protein